MGKLHTYARQFHARRAVDRVTAGIGSATQPCLERKLIDQRAHLRRMELGRKERRIRAADAKDDERSVTAWDSFVLPALPKIAARACGDLVGELVAKAEIRPVIARL